MAHADIKALLAADGISLGVPHPRDEGLTQ
jgi:hypothetical protein